MHKSNCWRCLLTYRPVSLWYTNFCLVKNANTTKKVSCDENNNTTFSGKLQNCSLTIFDIDPSTACNKLRPPNNLTVVASEATSLSFRSWRSCIIVLEALFSSCRSCIWDSSCCGMKEHYLKTSYTLMSCDILHYTYLWVLPYLFYIPLSCKLWNSP